jgi:CelD/BcsL family acetyltransferase involved in cellulose biosynthesis
VSPRSEWIAEPDRLVEIAAQWDRLANTDPAPFSLQAWLGPWWRAFGAPGRLQVCVVWDHGDLIAALPLWADAAGRLTATANAHTPAYRPLAPDRAARAALAEALASRGAELLLDAVPAEEPDTRELLDAVAALGARTVLDPAYVSPIADTSGAFDVYRKGFKSRWRELERRARKMAREHEVVTSAVAEPDDLERELSEGLELEASGWKGRERTAMLSEPATAGFYREMAGAFHDRGGLRLSSLRMDGRLVAFDLALLHRDRYFLLKTAYDESLRTLAPGLVLRRAVVERCFELGLEAHEFLGIDMEWKRLFATAEHRHFVWRAYPPGVAPALRYAYRRHARPRLRSAYRRLRPPT